MSSRKRTRCDRDTQKSGWMSGTVTVGPVSATVEPKLTSARSCPCSKPDGSRQENQDAAVSGTQVGCGPFPLLYFMIAWFIIHLRHTFLFLFTALDFDTSLHSVQVYSVSALLPSAQPSNGNLQGRAPSLHSGQRRRLTLAEGSHSALLMAAARRCFPYTNASSANGKRPFAVSG